MTQVHGAHPVCQPLAMVPFHPGLAVSLIVLLITSGQKPTHSVTGVGRRDDVIPGILTLIDLSLAGNLLLIVIFSGYGNFVSEIDHVGIKDRTGWTGNVDFGGLKLKLLASIVPYRRFTC